MHRALPVLAAQTFAGNALVRGLAGRRLEQVLGEPSGALFALVDGRRVAVAGGADVNGPHVPAALHWLDRAGLAALDLSYGGSGEHLSLGACPQAALPVYFLGEDSERRTLRLAVDVAAAPEGWARERGVLLQDLRSLMPLLPPGELAMAGHAAALSQWHQAHAFCSRCGAATASVAGGARRQCAGDPAHRQYPRTDPVVIMLVESPDGGAALLGRSKKMRGGMLTCLSGFVDQGEGIEEAVARETREEAGILVAAVDIVGSQPWPIGRGGSCELMIGCIARAASSDITIDPEEMEEVQWVSRADVAAAVRASAAADSPYFGGSGDAGGFFVPPPIAIAHHLLKRWAEHEGPWFGAEQQLQAGLAAAAAEAEPAAVSNL